LGKEIEKMIRNREKKRDFLFVKSSTTVAAATAGEI
jgi:hypothetical protein